MQAIQVSIRDRHNIEKIKREHEQEKITDYLCYSSLDILYHSFFLKYMYLYND